MSDILEPPKHKNTTSPEAENANPFAARGGDAGKTAGGETLRMVIIALAIVLFGLTLAVLFVLPKLVSSGPAITTVEQTTPEQATPIEPSIDESVVQSADNDKLQDNSDLLTPPEPSGDDEKLVLRQTAQTLLAEADEKLQIVKNKNAGVWAPKKLKQATDDLSAGETAYSEQRYQAATNSYQKVIADLEDLDQQSTTVLTESLAEGELALAAGNAADAQAAFARGLLIDPNNSVALNGKKRAERLDEVLALVKEAQGFEELGETRQALSRYESALKIDPQTSAATQAINRINSEAREKSFRAAMSRGFNALDKKDYQKAKKHFTSANSIKPSDSNAAEALTQSNELIKTQKIEALMANANRKSQQEDWAAVEKSLKDAKRLDNSIAGVDARIGAARSRQALEQQLLKYTSEASRLRSNAVHAEALAVLSKAKGIASSGSKLNKQINRLEQTIAAARTPRTITLTSDDQTAVTVYKVGKFGAFSQKNLSLFPGSYVAVGKRLGYRDVRLEFSVIASNSAQIFDVRCEEQLQFGAR